MPSVRIATEHDFDAVLPLLQTFANTAIGPAHWRRLFFPPWIPPRPIRGFLLEEGTRAVGFFGCLEATRRFGGEDHIVRNLTSWVVLPEFRNHALKLFAAVTEERDITITCTTPRRETLPFYFRSGFRTWEESTSVLFPIPSPRALRRWMTSRAELRPDRIEEALRGSPAVDHFAAHREYPCRNLLLVHRGAHCLVTAVETRGRRARFARVLGASDPSVLLAALDALRFGLWRLFGTPFAMIERRMLCGISPSWARPAGMGIPYVIRPAGIAPESLDTLYTEAALLPL